MGSPGCDVSTLMKSVVPTLAPDHPTTIVTDAQGAPAPDKAQLRASVSVIIPVRRINAYIRESVPHLLSLRHPSLEIVILPDEIAAEDDLEAHGCIRIIPTGPIGPAEKRDRGAALAGGSILAFLDDDAYPSREWLDKALPHFANRRVAAVGGPAVTPPHDSFWQQASGWALSTRLGSGGALMRYLPIGKVRDVDDWPSVNLLVRKTDFDALGGFDCAYYPGEDTKLCLELTRTLGKRIVYEPEAVVYHHRRSLFWGHFKQVGQYAQHRGYFVRAFPATSRRLTYFLPSVLTTGLIAGLLTSVYSRPLRMAYTGAVLCYGIALALTAVSVGIKTTQPRLGMAASLGVALTHFWYGLVFIRGLFSRDLSH